MGRKGFTLAELLNVVAIIAILTAIFMPAIRAARGAALAYSAKLSIRQLGGLTNLYLSDHDDTFPPAMYLDQGRYRTWFGLQKQDDKFDHAQGILTSYASGKLGRDPLHRAKEYFGDMSGFGYNWGYLGSDINITLDYSSFPNCVRPANASEIADPARTVAFGTSVYYNAPWLKDGDGVRYDFGFIDPPKYWYGNPNVDFRHGDPPEVDFEKHEVRPKGWALFVTVAGGAHSMNPKQLQDRHFERAPRD